MEHKPEAIPAPADWDWEERYRANTSVWSGHVNGTLVAESAALHIGRAIDVGCGEGADAIWLAEKGWTVSALDVSATAVARGAAAAGDRNVVVDWIDADILDAPPELEPADLVSLHYPAFPVEHADAVTGLLTGWVRPHGTLLVVGHARPADPTTLPFNHDDWVQPATIAARMPRGWTVEANETRPRVGDHHSGSVHTHDVVFRARRSA